MISLRSIRLCTLGFAFLGAHVAYAEGGCPPGSYPIGGQGVQGCAPIPGAGGGVSQQSPSPPPRPLGEWIRTWGGVAVSPTTSDAGVSTGQLSKKAAERDAIAKCADSGARDCKVSVTYFNQCMSWVVPSGRTGNGRSGIGTGPTLERAGEMAQGICQNDQPGACTVIHENCTEQIFKKY
ncbi:DUF4189 domain-containing protein [Stenotrophomonas indicatrix]|uniref:DUF4189 domain-containing protein n=1 Tax=Stenotrophomonas indicatrix TaxID=2045451 RepID=UPI000FD74AB5|nr:DUF4189 domain-containing protein [Stenotrophomonas indicatrix]